VATRVIQPLVKAPLQRHALVRQLHARFYEGIHDAPTQHARPAWWQVYTRR